MPIQVKQEGPADLLASMSRQSQAQAQMLQQQRSTGPGRPPTQGGYAGALQPRPPAPGTQVGPSQTQAIQDQPTPDQLDYLSAKGVFGWTTIDDINIPYILRHEKPFVSVRIVEMKLLSKFPNVYPEELTKRPPLMSHYITARETNLLNEINNYHCQKEYGHSAFTNKDLVVKLSEFKDFYTLVKKCFTKEDLEKWRNAQMPKSKLQGGWLQINNTVVPYVCRAFHSERAVKKLLPLNVIRYAANLLANVQVPNVSPTESECTYLTETCKRAGVEFTFSVQSTRFVELSILQRETNSAIHELPSHNPFGHAQYNEQVNSANLLHKPVGAPPTATSQNQTKDTQLQHKNNANLPSGSSFPSVQLQPGNMTQPRPGFSAGMQQYRIQGGGYFRPVSNQGQGQYMPMTQTRLAPPNRTVTPQMSQELMHARNVASSSAGSSTVSTSSTQQMAAGVQQMPTRSTAATTGSALPPPPPYPGYSYQWSPQMLVQQMQQRFPRYPVAAQQNQNQVSTANNMTQAQNHLPTTQQRNQVGQSVQGQGQSITQGQGQYVPMSGVPQYKPPVTQPQTAMPTPVQVFAARNANPTPVLNPVSSAPADTSKWVKVVTLDGKHLRCLQHQVRTEKHVLINDILSTFFPKCSMVDFKFALESVLRVDIVKTSDAEESCLSKHHSLPLDLFKNSEMVKLSDFEDYLPQLRYMFKDEMEATNESATSESTASAGTKRSPESQGGQGNPKHPNRGLENTINMLHHQKGLDTVTKDVNRNEGLEVNQNVNAQGKDGNQTSGCDPVIICLD